MSMDEGLFHLSNQYMALQSSYTLLFTNIQEKEHVKRGKTTFRRERKNNPDQLIMNGISELEFRRLFRLTPDKFNILKDLLKQFHPLGHLFDNREDKMRGRPPIAFGIRIGLPLFYFGHTIDYVACGNFFGIAASTSVKIVEEFCDALQLCKRIYLKTPIDSDLGGISSEFNTFSDLKGICGCVDGTHIPIQLPPGADSRSFYCFKSFYSSLAVVICDAKYRIIGYSIGHTGTKSDSSVV